MGQFNWSYRNLDIVGDVIFNHALVVANLNFGSIILIVPEHMCLHPTTQHNTHKVHTLQVPNLVTKALIKDLAYKVYIWEGHCLT